MQKIQKRDRERIRGKGKKELEALQTTKEYKGTKKMLSQRTFQKKL